MFRSVKHWVWLLLFWFVLAGQVGAMPCDVDNDGDIDLNDLTLIQKSILARAAVTGPSDPRDPDQNGLINSIDGRLCALRCTRAKCSTINQTPFANAGPDQTVKVGDPVQLSGAASSDPDGDPLRYSWTFKNHPLGSLASLLDAVTVAPRFTADKPGQYVIQLIVSDGKLDSVPDTVIVSTENSRPIANAGPDQSVRVGTLVMLNGGGSTDVDGDPLTYTWQLASVPPGSGATLGNPDTVNPTLLIDQPGSYLIALTVSDGKVPSLPDTVAVTTENSPPVANPGPNQSIPLGATITLNGSHSSDVDGNPLTFRWSLLARPPGSAAVLSNPNTVTPSFNADAPGTYVAQLIVNDGTVDSAPASVTLTTANAAPIANAGPDQSAALGSSATLDGSASHDPEGAALTYTWSLTGRPAGSAATLSGSDTVNPSFTLDRPGNYIAQLIVSDGQLASAPDTVTLSTTNSRPVANAGAAQTVTAGTPVKLDGSASHDADSDPITFVWSLTTLPPGSNAAITPSDGVSPSFVPDLAGSYIAQLIVSDGQLSSVPATVVVTVNAANRKPIAVAEAIPTQTTVGSPVVLKGSASSDPDGDPLTWSWSIALRPGGSNASIVSPTAAQTSFVPDVPGIYTIQLVVRDGKVDSVPALVVVEAVAANHPPRIISSPPTLAVAGQAYSYPIVATDDDPGDVLTYSLVLAPPGMVMDGSSGRIQWVPQVDQVGSHGVTVRVSDRSGAFTEQSYSVTVSLSNRAPAIASTPLTIAAGGIPYSYAVNGTDPDAGDVLTYSLTSLPTGMSISQTTGLINWTPEETQGGNHLVTVRVQDTGGLFAEQSYTISVCAAPPPGMVGWWGGEGDGRDLLGRFNGTLVDAPGFAPGKVDQAFSLVGGPEHVSIPDDAALNLVDAISVEAWIKPSAFVAGYDPIVKKAGEGLGQTDGYALEFLGQNVAFFVDVPGWFLSEWFLSAPAPLNLGEWMHVVGTYDGSYVRLYANGVRVDPPTHAPGRIKASGNPLNIGHDPANPNRAFSGLIDEATIYNRALSLEEVQAIYRMGSAGKCKAGFPMANAGPDQSVDEGATVTLDGTISKDPAGRPITFAWSILNSPAGSSPVLSGAATGMPTLLADKRGIYIAQLIVNNGLTESLPDTVVIRAAAVPNHAPRITPSPPTIAVVGKTYSYPVVAADDDVGDALTYSFRRVPFYPVPAEMTINAANGLIVWTPTLAQVGSHYVTVRVTDAGGLVAEETFVLVVTPTPPVITSAPVTSATVAQPYTYAVTATDPDPGDTLTYSLTTAPPGMVIDGASGLIQWTPTAAQAGDHPVEVKVQDAGGLFVTQPFTLSVAAVLVCVPPPSGLVSWWPGDGNTLDRAAASDGLAENGASYAAGLVGQAFRFDGVDDLTRIASSRTTGFAGAFSVEFWFNPTTTINVSTPNQMLLAKGRYLEGGFNAPVAIQVLGGDGRLLVRMPSAPALVSSTDTWPAGTWQHIALSWDGARYRLYVNGSEEAGLDNAFSIFDSSDPITLGNADGFAAGGFAGLLDEPTLYNRALTPAEVNALHAARGLGKCTATYSRADAGPDQAVEVAATVTLDGSASRAFDGAPLSYQWTLTSRPANSAAVLANPATVSPSFTADKAGAYTLDLIVSNAGRASAPDSVSITAAKVNHPPTITSTAITAGAVGTAYTYPVTASDPDPGDTLTFSLTTAPAGMSINAASGLIQWTPNAGQIGSHAVTIRVQDQGGLFAPQSFLVVVAATPVPVSVPSVVGQEQAAAQSAISAASLTVGTVSLAASDTVAAGRVISQNPTAGTLVSSGSAVALVVSSGQAGPAVTAIRVTPLNALILTGQSQAFAATGILSNGSSLPLTSGLTWTSSTPAVASIDVAGVASALSEGSTTISVSQGGVSGSTTLNVKAAVADGTKPTAAITAPTSGATVSTAIPVTGTAADDNFLKYVLEIAPFGQPSFTTIAVGTVPVVNGALGVLDPTTLVNDYYLLRLTVFDRAGNQQTAEVDFQVARDKKVGNFTLAFQDVNVPMAGIPISVVRSYDSRDKTKGDFGIGWRLDVNSIRLRVTGVEGADWFEDKTLAIFPTYSLAPTRKHLVTITLPDGRVEEFDFSVVPSSREFVPLDIVRATYVPRGITRGSLRPADADELLVQSTAGVFPGAVELYAIVNPVAPYAPAAYDYTTPEGQTIRITRAGVVQYIRDRNGNTVTFGPLGVTHSAGLSIAFTRDSEGRITQVTDPNGNVQRYAYDINGDLASHTDAQGRVTSFLYNFSHGLIEIRDPRGVRPIRNEYDDAGRLIKTIDAFGKEIVFTHELAANREIITDRLGRQTIHEYDDQGNVTRTTDANGGVTARSYDARGNTLSETDPLGRTRSYTYDANNNRLSETDALGKVTTTTYNANRQVLTITDALGRVTSNTYDARGNLISMQDAAGNTTSYSYDASGLPLSRTNALGQVTVYEYDGPGRVVKETEPVGGKTTSYTYDANGNRLTQTVTRTLPGGGKEALITHFDYDAMNRVVKTTQPDGSVSQVAYNAIGKQDKTIDALGRETRYEYDDMGRLARTSYPDGTSETSTYDAEGRRTGSTDRAGRTTTSTYDALGRLTATTFPDGSGSSTAYDAAGQVLTSTDARGNATTYAYDGAGRRTQVIDALGKATTFSYDDLGNQTRVTDANGNAVAFTYDANNRRTRTTYADGTFEQVSYDALGRQTAKTDQAGKTTQFAYDALGRLINVTDALGQITTYSYDEQGNQLTQTDAEGRTTRFAYDRMGRRSSRTLPLGQTETSTYDAAGNLRTKTDFNGRTTSYAYDSVNRLLRKTPDGSLGQPPVVFTYTPSGQRAGMQDASGSTTYSYDSRDRLLSKATPQGTLSYSYDAAGNLTRIQSNHAGGAAMDYSYDARNRLATVTDAEGRVTSYSYDAVGNLAGFLYPNGVQTTYTYNPLNRLTNVTGARGATTIAGYTYTLGPSGNRVAVTEASGRRVDYTYDDLYRLRSETISADPAGPNGAIAYTYDKVGNRLVRTSTVAGITDQSFEYDFNDRLGGEGYDNNGNTLTSGGRTFGYDFENHLTSADGGVSFVYNGDGIRVAKTAGGVTTGFLVDDRNPTGYAQVLEEIVGGAVERSYTYGLKLISQKQASGVSFYGYDGHGSVRFLTRSDGVATDAMRYDAFGVQVSHAGLTANSYLYLGEQFENELNSYYLRNRYLDPSIGRFRSIDPVDGDESAPATLHSYVYGGGNPVNMIDPDGLSYSPETGRAVEAVVGWQYAHTHPKDRISYGAWAGVGWLDNLKPDILNFTRKKFLEIKPLSRSGIAAGLAQMAYYCVSLCDIGYSPDTRWIVPNPVGIVDGRLMAIANIGGLVFYTDQYTQEQLNAYARQPVQQLRNLLLEKPAQSLISVVNEFDLVDRLRWTIASESFGREIYYGVLTTAVIVGFYFLGPAAFALAF